MNRNTSFAGVHSADAIHQRLAGDVLEKITFRSCLNSTVDIFIPVKRGEHDNSRVLIVSTNGSDRANTIELGHSQIEQCHIGTMLFPKIDRLAAVARFADNCHLWFATNHRYQTFANDAVVSGDQNSKWRFLL